MDKPQQKVIQEKKVEEQLHIQEKKVEEHFIFNQKYLEEKFRGLHIQFDAEFSLINERLNNILNQTIKTNSRVTHVEEDIVALKIQDRDHIIYCPIAPKLEEYKKEQEKKLEDITFFSRHPKLGIAILTIFMIIFLGSSLAFLNSFKKNVKEIRTEQIKTEQIKENTK